MKILQNIWIRKYILLLFIIFVYCTLTLLVIDKGIPNLQHPFTYNMDEWHQLMAVRSVFKHGTPNVPGAANGSMFQFFLSGVFLIPFTLLGIIHPLSIHSSVQQLEDQKILFEVLRFNTLLFGIGSIVMMTLIAKRFFQIPAALIAFIFTCTPVFLMLSNYFKYDVALLFWLTVSFYMILRSIQAQSRTLFILSGLFVGVSLATKLSAVPLIPLYLYSFFLFRDKNKSLIVKGLSLFVIVFVIAGIPDILFHSKDYVNFIIDNIHDVPNTSSLYHFGQPLWSFMFLSLYPSLFGHLFYMFAVTGICVSLLYVKKNEYRLLLVGFFLFAISLIPLQLYATGNRTLVLLPFLTTFVCLFIKYIYKYKRSFGIFVFILFFCFQSIETYSWVAIKLAPFPQMTASDWVLQHLPSGTHIGIENIPLYQMLPDIIVKEFYDQQYTTYLQTKYRYTVIDEKTRVLPTVIILSNPDIESKVLPSSSKIALLHTMQKLGYKKLQSFPVPRSLNSYFTSDTAFHFSGLISSQEIIVYRR